MSKNTNSFNTPLIFMVVTGVFFGALIIYLSSRSNSYWAEVKAQSEAHNTLAAAFVDCRRRIFSNDTREECLLMVKDYADLAGIDDARARQVLLEIKTASDDYRLR